MSGVAAWYCRKPHGPRAGGAEIGRSIGSKARTAPGWSKGAQSSPPIPDMLPMPENWPGDPKPGGDCECRPGDCVRCELMRWLGRPACVGGGVHRWSSERVPSPSEREAAAMCARRAACSPEAFAALAQSSPPTLCLPSGLSADAPPGCGGGGDDGGGDILPKLAGGMKAKRPLPLGSRMGCRSHGSRAPPASLPPPSSEAPSAPATASDSMSKRGADAGRSGSSIHGRHESSPGSNGLAGLGGPLRPSR
mmetsp:Transcript_1431/g.2797  ORF Transcript_1431/g.2797 Transcript_1431/m.2797 type:complete len:250 (-) Transcript_1431:197-946(-)